MATDKEPAPLELKIRETWLPEMLSNPAPGPLIVTDLLIASCPDLRVIVPVTLVASIVFGPGVAFDCVMQYRMSPLMPLPVPVSPMFVTVNVAGTIRSSSARRNNQGFDKRGRRFGRLGAIRRRIKRDMGRLGKEKIIRETQAMKKPPK
jgi:hypothetical protein